MEYSEHNHHFGKIIADSNMCEKRIQLIRRCTICGYTEHIGLLGTISPHQFSEPFIIKKSTCMATGCASLKCKRCGYTKQIELPQSVHHYKKNSLFYETCCDCRKRILTPLTKRLVMILGTVFLAGGFAAFGMYLFGKYQHNETTPCIKNVISVSSETSTDTYTKIYISSLSETNIYECKQEIQSSCTPSYVKETVDSHMAASEAHINNTSKESKETRSSKEYLASPAPDSSSPVEEGSIMPSNTANSYETFNETAALPITSICQQAITSTAIPAQPITTQSEIQTATSEKHAETVSAKDYSWLMGEIVNGSDLLKLIEEGAPIEIITNTGIKFSANVDISGTISLSDTNMISETDSYFVNVTFIGHQQVIILNQF